MGLASSYTAILMQTSRPVCIPLNTNMPSDTILYLVLSNSFVSATVGIKVLSLLIP